MGTLRVLYIAIAIILLSNDATAQYDTPGIQELVNNVWPSGSGTSLNSPLDALDAMLVLLNSRKLHRRQAPSTCPYCPTGYPCSQGCPTVPPLYPPTGGIAMPGLPGPPGPPGFPIYFPGLGGCPGPSGPPGICIPGNRGVPGADARRVNCHAVADPQPITIDASALRQLIFQHLSCNTVRRCRYSIDDLLLRLHRVESTFNLLEPLKQRLSAIEQALGRLRQAYIDKQVRGVPGRPGPMGIHGRKGTPGYDGQQGICEKSKTKPPSLPRGMPGVPGPKGEPGSRGNKICNCNGISGDSGVVGPSLVGLAGPRGYKGSKGVAGTPGRRSTP